MDLKYVDSGDMIVALVMLVAALVFYSIGVWTEHVRGKVRFTDLLFILIGLVCQAVATGFLHGINSISELVDESHLLLGILCILIILFHVFWAMWALTTIKKPDARAKFNRFSIFIWCIWLIPYFLNIYFTVSSHFS